MGAVADGARPEATLRKGLVLVRCDRLIRRLLNERIPAYACSSNGKSDVALARDSSGGLDRSLPINLCVVYRLSDLATIHATIATHGRPRAILPHIHGSILSGGSITI